LIVSKRLYKIIGTDCLGFTTALG